MSFSVTKLLLHNLGFDLQVGQLISQTLIIDSKLFPLLLSTSHFLFQQNSALNANVVFGLHVLQGRGSVPCLSLVVIVGNFDISQFQLKGTIRVSQGGDLLLQGILRGISLSLRLLVFGLPGATSVSAEIEAIGIILYTFHSSTS